MKRSDSLFLLALAVLVFSSCARLESPAPVTHYGASQGAGSVGVHFVQQGDTLWSISQRYNIPIRDIADVNDLSPPFALAAGTRLRLPPPHEYTVRPGDSLYSVSRLFGVSSSQLVALNHIDPPYTVIPHQVLRLPAVIRQPHAPPQEPQQIQTAQAAQPAPVSGVQREALPATPGPKPVQSGSSAPVQTAQIYTPPARPAPKDPISAATPKRSSSGRLMRPVSGKVISGYGTKAGGLHNDGINIAAPKGTAVRAAENGVVVYAGNELKGSGNLILVRHEGRLMTAYAHMDQILIRRGDVIKRGQTIGTVGSTGSVDTPQLHFEVRRGTEAINPQVWIEG